MLCIGGIGMFGGLLLWTSVVIVDIQVSSGRHTSSNPDKEHDDDRQLLLGSAYLQPMGGRLQGAGSEVRPSPYVYYMTHGCERTTLHLSCSQRQQRHVMYVSRATYGRTLRHLCPPPVRTRNALDLCLGSTRTPTAHLATECNGKERCQLGVSNRNFGDPCPGVFKYLEVYYYCVPTPL